MLDSNIFDFGFRVKLQIRRPCRRASGGSEVLALFLGQRRYHRELLAGSRFCRTATLSQRTRLIQHVVIDREAPSLPFPLALLGGSRGGGGTDFYTWRHFPFDASLFDSINAIKK